MPHALLSFLRAPRLLKVGVHVQADLTRLFNDCGFQGHAQPFLGALELGRLAKDQNLVNWANISLAELVATILGYTLPKDDTIRVSTGWDNPTLTQEQETYAALDVFAVYSVYDTFTHLPGVGPVTDATAGGAVVKLLSRDKSSIVAYGVIAPDRPAKFGGVNVSKTRTVINVTRILASGYLLRSELSSSQSEVPLSSFGTVLPFQILCCTKDLHICTGKDITEAQILQNTEPTSPAIMNLPPPPPDSYTSAGDPIASENPRDHTQIYTEGIADNGEDYDPETENLVEEAEQMPHDDAALLEETLLFILGDECVRSRVIGDTWHLMDMFKISVHHGLRRAFTRALRDALFMHDPDDKLNMTDFLAKEGITYEQKILWSSDWVWKQVKRYIPAPEILLPWVSAVFQKYGPLLDATTKQPLFNDAAWEVARRILENIRLGYYSDPPGVTLYRSSGYDSNGLALYQCLRGTNNVEGGVHQSIAKRFGSYNASPHFAVNLLRDYCFTHNLNVSETYLHTILC